MGRKSVDKDRKRNKAKKAKWASTLFPYFQEYGLTAPTMNQLAKWLGKSKSTLYEYFESKSEIIDLALDAKLEELSAVFPILSTDEQPYVERYIAFFEFLSTHVSDISTAFLKDLRKDYPQAWTKVDAFLSQIITLLEAYYRGGIAAGEFKPINVALMLRMDRHFVFEVLMDTDFLTYQQLSLKQLVEDYLNAKLAGIRK